MIFEVLPKKKSFICIVIESCVTVCIFVCVRISVYAQRLQHSESALIFPPSPFFSPQRLVWAAVPRWKLSSPTRKPTDRQAPISCSFDSLAGWLAEQRGPQRNGWGRQRRWRHVYSLSTGSSCLYVCTHTSTHRGFLCSLKEHSFRSGLPWLSLVALPQTDKNTTALSLPLSYTYTHTLTHTRKERNRHE